MNKLHRKKVLLDLRLFVSSDSVEKGRELTEFAADVGTAGGGGKGAANGAEEFEDGVVCSDRGPAIVVTGD